MITAMNKSRRTFVASLVLVTVLGPSVGAAQQEWTTVQKSVEVVQAMSAIPLKCIPPALLHDAVGVAIIPHVVKAGLLIDKRFGRGVVLVRQPDGSWSNPVFVTLEGAGVGLQAGYESTDLVLVFKNPKSLDRILKGKGKLTLGTDASIAAGPVGRETETATDGWLKADVFSYSRSRGLFAGISLEGSHVNLDLLSNEVFYGLHGGRPEDVLGHRGPPIPAAEALRGELMRLSGPPEPIIRK